MKAKKIANAKEWQLSMQEIAQIGMSTTKQLISLALLEENSSDAFKMNEPLVELQKRATVEVLNEAISLSKSSLEDHRLLATQILGQLGIPNRKFPKRCCKALVDMLNVEVNEDVVASTIFALGHLGDPRCAPSVRNYANSSNCRIRHAVAFCLCGIQDSDSIGVLIGLMNDECDITRDWATTGLAYATSADSEEVRRLLLDRMLDSDEFVRAEAAKGLCRRKDNRVIPYIISELNENRDSRYLFIEAANYLLYNEDDRTSDAGTMIGILNSIKD